MSQLVGRMRRGRATSSCFYYRRSRQARAELRRTRAADAVLSVPAPAQRRCCSCSERSCSKLQSRHRCRHRRPACLPRLVSARVGEVTAKPGPGKPGIGGKVRLRPESVVAARGRCPMRWGSTFFCARARTRCGICRPSHPSRRSAHCRAPPLSLRRRSRGTRSRSRCCSSSGPHWRPPPSPSAAPPALRAAPLHQHLPPPVAARVLWRPATCRWRCTRCCTG
jgi:hypothetical protein